MTLLPQYLPVPQELTPEQLQSARQTLEDWLRILHPDIGFEPGTPAGDLHITPLAELFAALEVAIGRIRGDHDLDNIQSGKAHVCELASQFVDNFLPYRLDSRPATGYVRLVFRTDQDRDLDRGLKFQFDDFEEGSGDPTRSLFYARLFHPGPAHIRRSGRARRPYHNDLILRRVGPDQYATDLPLEGAMLNQVTTGAVPRLNMDVPDLVSVRVLFDFGQGVPTSSLAERASQAQVSLYGAGMGNRAGIQALLRYEFPDLLASSPVMTGDYEITRASVNALGIATPCLDVFVKSNQAALLDRSLVRLEYHETQGGESVRQFCGPLELPAFPIYLEDIRYAGNTRIDLGRLNGFVRIWSRTPPDRRAPLASAGFSPEEKLFISVQMPTDQEGNDLIPIEQDPDGRQYAYFQLDYRYDPTIPVVDDYFQSRQNQLINTIVLVRAFLPIVFDLFEVRYVRPSGRDFNRQYAIDQIYDYIARLGYPNLYHDGRIEQLMLRAGAQQVLSIGCRARVRFSMADTFLPHDAPAPHEDFLAATTAAIDPPQIQMNQSDQLRPHFRDLRAGTGQDSYAVVSRHNVAYLLDKSRIALVEELA